MIEACVATHEAAATARSDEAWLRARAEATRCAAVGCPLALRSDCRSWLDEIAALLPTLLVVVERDDGQVGSVTLELDEQSVPVSDPPQPLEVTPGQHHLRVLSAGYAPLEFDVRLERGEKNHVIRARFVAPPAAAPKTPPAPAGSAARAPHVVHSRPVPPATYVYAGGAIAAFGLSGALLGSALASRSTARDECAPACASSVRRSIDTRLLLADVAGAAGLVLGGLALYTYVTRPTQTQPALSLALHLGASREPRLLLQGGF